MRKLICAVTVLAVSTARADTIYVDDDAPPGGDGSSWVTAYRFLQDALADAAASGGSVTEIRVAQGTYTPDQDGAGDVMPGDREASFQLVGGVALRGGFAGLGSPDRDERDIQLFQTILSGDLLGNDDPDFANMDENSFQVVTANAVSGALLEGVTVMAGNAQGDSFFTRAGGGMFADDSTVTISQCAFRDNSADENGGALLPNLTTLTVCDCTFEDNRSLGGPSTGGGAITGFHSDMAFTDCVIRGNTAVTLAGGIASASNVDDTYLTLTNCLISGNTAGLVGGGVFGQKIDVAVTRCTIADNEALHVNSGAGGGMWIVGVDASLTMINTLVEGNFAQVGGAGVLTRVRTTVVNSTISRNEAGLSGGGLYASLDAIVSVQNCVLWENSVAGVQDETAQVSGDPDAEVSVGFSCVQGLTGDLGGGNIDADPLFVDPDNGDFRLQTSSPANDAGHNWAIAGLADTDLDGNPRFAADKIDFDPGCGIPVVVDMGAYEYQGDPFPVRLGDIDGDGAVGIIDFLGLLAAWGPCPKDCCLADLDIDGDVGIADFLTLLGNWG